MIDRKLLDYKSDREPILSDKARELMRRMEADPELAADFFRRAGIWDEKGGLTAPYRTEPSEGDE